MGKGTLALKIRVPGCERIRRLSGTNDPKMRAKLVRMIHVLHEQGRDDLVNAIARGLLKPLQVYNHWRFNRLDELPHADELPRFRDVWPAFLAEVNFSDDHGRALEGYYQRLERLMPVDAPMSGLVEALRVYREEHLAKPRSFEYAQNAVARLVKHTLGRRHRLYLEVRDLPKLRPMKKRRKHPLTPNQLRNLVRALGDPCGGEAWTMALTGMGWREYTGEWEREGDGLRIHGTKTHGRDRLIPYVSILWHPKSTYTVFRNRLRKATDGEVTPYDLRRTFANLMREAGVPMTRRRLYMGHSAKSMTEEYEFHEVSEYLQKDAERIRILLGEPPEGPNLQVLRA